MGLAETAELAVRISLKDGISGGVRGIQKNLGSLNSSLARTGKGVGQIGAGVARAGLIIGGAVATGLGAAAKNAIDFQDAFAGVRKTIEASPAELDALDQALRKLSTRIPVNYTDLAGIAQEAGALGVPTKEVANFTEVVSRLSAATVGLTVDAAAEAFGKLGNVLQLHGADYEKMGSSLIALGNAGASSEGDIIEVAKRFGAAGATAKLSAAQVLGFSSAIASMGVEPEAAGSSLSRLFNNITKYIGTGNKKIKGFADVTKLSVKDFSKYFAKDASGAVQLFLKDLSKLDRFKASAKLKEAGIINVRDINAVLLLSRGYAELGRQVTLSEDAFAKNTALQEVSAKRFDTLKAKITELKNGLVLASVTLAEGFLPALGRSVAKLQEFLALDSTKSSLKGIGEDIGKAIDNINWDEVLTGVKSLVETLRGALTVAKGMYDVFSTLPGPIKEAAAGFLVLNKLSGNLIASGAGNIIGGLGGVIAKSAGSRLPVVGALFAQPVFVTNWPLGGVGGGLPGALGGAAAAGGAGIAVSGTVAAAAIVASAAVSVIATQDLLSKTTLAQRLANGGLHAQQYTGSGAAFNNKPVPVNVVANDARNFDRGETATSRNPILRPSFVDSPRASAASAATIAAIIARGRAGGFHPTSAAAEATNQKNVERIAAAAERAANRVATLAGDTRSEKAGIISAIGGIKPPTVNVNVHVTASQVTKSITIQNRYGPGNGSRGNKGVKLANEFT